MKKLIGLLLITTTFGCGVRIEGRKPDILENYSSLINNYIDSVNLYSDPNVKVKYQRKIDSVFNLYVIEIQKGHKK